MADSRGASLYSVRVGRPAKYKKNSGENASSILSFILPRRCLTFSQCSVRIWSWKSGTMNFLFQRHAGCESCISYPSFVPRILTTGIVFFFFFAILYETANTNKYCEISFTCTQIINRRVCVNGTINRTGRGRTRIVQILNNVVE